jgi:hypothetical protein
MASEQDGCTATLHPLVRRRNLPFATIDQRQVSR